MSHSRLVFAQYERLVTLCEHGLDGYFLPVYDRRIQVWPKVQGLVYVNAYTREIARQASAARVIIISLPSVRDRPFFNVRRACVFLQVLRAVRAIGYGDQFIAALLHFSRSGPIYATDAVGEDDQDVFWGLCKYRVDEVSVARTFVKCAVGRVRQVATAVSHVRAAGACLRFFTKGATYALNAGAYRVADRYFSRHDCETLLSDFIYRFERQ